jgi:putative ABC transport system permease protein
MTAPVGTNRKMFWRIIRRLLFAHRGRLFVILLALGTGAAVTAALLNLQVDAKRRLTAEFRAFGANVIVAPRNSGTAAASQDTLDESILQQIPSEWDQRRVDIVPFLYVIADAHKTGSNRQVPVVVAGKGGGTLFFGSGPRTEGLISCAIGARVAAQMQLKPHDRLILQSQARQQPCNFASISSTGGPEDDQIIVAVVAAQDLAALPRRISLVELTVPGTPQEISSYIRTLRQRLPDADVRPIRQFTEAEAKIYNRISGVLTATVAIVLLLTGLCVMAAMTNVAMERRNDVGLMKAIGGASRRVLRLFLVEAALIGLTGGLLGAAAGIALSIGLGKAVFGMAARPRLIVYPVAVALTIIVAIAGAFPLRRLTSIRPASVFRGEA